MLKKMVNIKFIFITMNETVGIAFIETSALDSTNVERAFMNVIKEIFIKATTE
jgi:hypothetical protein